MKGSMKVTPIEGKIIEARLRWYGHVMRRDDDGIVRKELDIQENEEVQEDRILFGKHVCGKKKLEEATVQDIRFWRLIVRTADPK
jgi:hypothetical protein